VIRAALDTNVLAYAAGVDRSPDDGAKIDAARALIARLATRAMLVAPVQALAELYVVLTRAGETREGARETVLRMHAAFGHADSASATLLSALDAATAHKLQLWDALILTAAAEAGCTLLLSEDMGPGLTWRGVTVVNPFAAVPDRRLAI
jgi:predicted nucleic acid-binding protein